jgi:hypothetical protein
MKNPAVPKVFRTGYLIVKSYYFHIRSLTPQQAARNALAIRFKIVRSIVNIKGAFQWQCLIIVLTKGTHKELLYYRGF